MASEQLGDKMSAEDKAAIEKVTKEGREWLHSNECVEDEDRGDDQNEVKGVVQPIVAKAYQQAGTVG